MRTHGIDRWNWSIRAGKWVYVDLKNGKREYKYQKETPNEYEILISKIKALNLDLLNEEDPEKNKALYEKMMKLTKQLQVLKK